MKLINQLLEEVHMTRVYLQHKKPEPVKLAVYINHLTWHELCRELYSSNTYRSDICLAGMSGNKDHIIGYPVYEVITKGHPHWSVVEVFDAKEISPPRKLSREEQDLPTRSNKSWR